MIDQRFNEMLSHNIFLSDAYCANHFQFRIDEQPISTNATERIFDYAARIMSDKGNVACNDMWSLIGKNHQPLIQSCLNRDFDQFGNLTKVMAQTHLVLGFMNYFPYQDLQSFEQFRKIEAFHCIDKLISLAEYLAAVPLLNPQQGPWQVIDPAFLPYLEAAFTFRNQVISPPQAGGGAFGLATNLGVYTIKDFYGRFTGGHVLDICQLHDLERVLEIGGGLGFASYYASKLGSLPYTIFDLPAVSVMQAHFSMRSLGEENVYLDGEIEDHVRGVMLRPFWRVSTENSSNSLWLNQDSLPEIDIDVAKGYLKKIAETERGCFLSINQEASAGDLIGGMQHRVPILTAQESRLRRQYRSRDFLRLGYTEELYSIGRRHF